MKSFIINRDNYEEFFLLFVDNELNAADRKAVEEFVSQHEDLSQELEMLQQSKLEDNPVEFFEKESLYKREIGISLSNYEEYFLLSTDNELNEQQRNEVEKFVLKHPELQQQFTLLQQAKLTPERIDFKGKESLYRTVEKERRRIPLFWSRLSIAAAIAGLVAASYLLNNEKINSTDKQSVAKVIKNASQRKESLHILVDTVKEKSQDLVKQNNENRTSRKDVKAIEAASIAKGKTEKTPKNETIAKQVDATQSQQSSIENFKNEVAVSNDLPIQNDYEGTKKIRSADSSFRDKESTNETIFAHQTVTEEKPVLFRNAVYREIDNTEGEEKSINIGGSQINKNKLKGLFKKAVSFLEKKGGKKDDKNAAE